MAFVSTAMLISRPDPHRKSLMMSLHNELKSLCKPFSSIGMVRPRKCVAPVSMSFIEDAAGAKRRIGSHHCNIWDDDVIHSLSTPYGALSYSERAEVLIKEVRDMFNSISSADGELNALVLQRLWMVDNVERLGIDRHFKYEIKAALDFVYSCWNETGIGCDRDSILPDLNSTALALRTLRLHGYTVSSDVLENFKSENGQFACFALKTEGKSELRGILNLFRASSIAFPGEKIMEEAQIFAKKYLKEAIQEIPVSHLSLEMEYILEYGWQTNLPRLEARNYIEVFGKDSLYISAPCINIEILLELAKLEFNIFHSIQLRELQCLSRWWTDSDLPQVTFARHRHVEFYCLASCIALDPKHSAFRLGFAKSCHIATVLDDIYDTYGTISELQLFTEAVRRWDPSAIERLPEYMKGVYMVLYEAVNEMAREAKKMQGRDTLNYARKAWEAQLDAVMQEAEWIASNYMPTFEEYFNNAKVSFGYRIATLQPILTLDIPLPHHILEQIDFPSRFNELAWSMLRLRGDTRTYKVEMARGEEASSISCYMKDNPGSTEEDALNHINTMIGDIIKELNWEFLRPDSNVPISSKKHAFEISRAIHHLYKDRDGYSVADGETKNFVMRTMLEPVPM